MAIVNMLSRWRGSILLAALVLTFFLYFRPPLSLRESYQQGSSKRPTSSSPQKSSDKTNAKFNWKDVPQKYPLTSMKSMPTIAASNIPRIQHNFKKETADVKRTRLVRLQLIKGNFTHAWRGYKAHAWLRDEVKPISGGSEDPFGGWAASMVDSLG